MGRKKAENSEKEMKREKNLKSYSCTALKEALLKKLTSVPFEKIEIVELCKTANISRSAFYLHYKSIEEVLEELIEEALEEGSDIVYYILGSNITESGNNKKRSKSEAVHTACKDLSSDRMKYNVILHDNTALIKLIDKISYKYKDAYIADFSRRFGFRKSDAEIMFYFQLGGFLTSSYYVGNDSFKKIKKIRRLLDSLGFK